MFNVQTLFDNLDESNSVDWQFDFHGLEVYIADSPCNITCNINKIVTNSSKEIFMGRNKVGYNDF